MKLFLLRHGQTDHNLNGYVQGWYDTHLNQTGIEQAQAAADDFDKEIDAIFCSDLARTQETAKPFRAKFPTTTFFLDWRIRERQFGEAENKLQSIQDWDAYWSAEDYVSIPGAETHNEFDLRLGSFLDDLRSYHTKYYSTVLIITHGGAINGLQRLLSPDSFEYHHHQNGSLIELTL